MNPVVIKITEDWNLPLKSRTIFEKNMSELEEKTKGLIQCLGNSRIDGYPIFRLCVNDRNRKIKHLLNIENVDPIFKQPIEDVIEHYTGEKYKIEYISSL